MNDYFQNNLFVAYQRFIWACMTVLSLSTILCVYTLNHAYQHYSQTTKNTFVFSENGKSVHVFVKTK